MRYVNLSIVLVFRLVSQKVKDRFPDYQSMVLAKLMLPSEVKRIQKAEAQTPHEATWTPILWALKLLQRARTEGKIQVHIFNSILFENHANSILLCKESIIKLLFRRLLCKDSIIKMVFAGFHGLNCRRSSYAHRLPMASYIL